MNKYDDIECRRYTDVKIAILGGCYTRYDSEPVEKTTRDQDDHDDV
jgi:hypothetical protein